MGRGSVKMEIEGITQVITQVYYILELKNNLLSLSQLQEMGLTILIKNGICKMFHPFRGLIMKSVMFTNRMSVIIATITSKEQACFKTTTEEETELWHCQYGHLSYKGLKTFYDKKMVMELPPLKIPMTICEWCIMGKQHRDSFPKQIQWRDTTKLS